MPSAHFEEIFARLRRVLTNYANSLSVAEDSPKRYCLEGRVGPAALRAWGGKAKQPMIPVAWVQISKACVSFHLMGLYRNKKAREGMSQELRARMQASVNLRGRRSSSRHWLGRIVADRRAIRIVWSAVFMAQVGYDSSP